MKTLRESRYVTFSLYLVVVVLVNLAAVTLFFRFDLTAGRVYSLSEASKKVIAAISEPLTVKVFFTRNLPAPYNGTERYLRDLLGEYSLYANRYFNYTFYDVSPEAGEAGAGQKDNQEEARSYGIYPVQIQHVENDEMKFKNAYMGLAIIHGDAVAEIPTITSTDGLEYRLTTTIQKLNNKISTLLSLPAPIRVKVFLSSSLTQVAPYIGVKELPHVATTVAEIVATLNKTHYGKLSYQLIDPSKEGREREVADRYKLMLLQWPDLPDGTLAKGRGVIGCVLEYGGKTQDIPLLNVMRIPILGTRYELVEKGRLEEAVKAGVESLIGINEKLGCLSGHGTLDMSGRPPMGSFDGRGGDDLSKFSALVSQVYSLEEVRLSDEPVPPQVRCLVIARPTEPFTDYELYQIDQMLMRGTNLAVFLEAFKEVNPSPQNPFGDGGTPTYLPIDTGLEKLLADYGVTVKKSYVMDEHCYRQEMPEQLGGGDRPIYFAPIIQQEFISKEFSFTSNIKGIVVPRVSPLELDERRLKEKALRAGQVLASSNRSWEMKEHITFNPLFISPPLEESAFKSMPIACVLEGEFESYFAGRPVPVKEAAGEEKEGMGATAPSREAAPLAPVEGEREPLTKSRPAKIFVMASSEMLGNNVLDDEGRSTNAMFVMNVIDYLSDRDDIVALRSREQRFNPLFETGPLLKTGIKTFNIVVLPLLVVLCGLVVWLRRIARRKELQMMFPEKRG